MYGSPTAARPAAPAQRQQKAPFRYNTRQRFRSSLGQNVAIAFGSTGSALLPQNGELARVFLFVGASITNNAGSPAALAAAEFGPWNLLKRIQVITNQGASNIFDCSGYGTYQLMKSRYRNADFKTALAGVTNDPLYQFPVGTFTTTVAKNLSFCIIIPIAGNYGKNFGLGAQNLQAPEVRINVQLQFGNASDVYTGTDVGTGSIVAGGTVQVAYEYYEIPPPQRNAALPPLIAHRCLEERFAFGTAQVIYQVPRAGKLLRLISTLTANGALVTGGGTAVQGTSTGGNAPSAGLDRWTLKFNLTDEVYQQDYIYNRLKDRQYLGAQELDAGSYLLELWGAEGDPATGDFRDQVDTEAITTVQSVYDLNSSLTLGSNNNYVDVVREIWQPLAATAVAGGQ